MKALRSFFDHTRVHETAVVMRKPLGISLTVSTVLVILVAPAQVTVACLFLLILSLGMYALDFTVALIAAYFLAGIVLLALRSSLAGGVTSPEFAASIFIVLALCQSLKLKTYAHCQTLLIWLLASNATTALLDSSATVSVWILLVMFLNLTQFLRLHVKNFSLATLAHSLRSAVRTAIYTLPMLLVFIYVFHRSNANGHQMSESTVSGISSNLEPGQVSKLSLRSGVAYRISLNRPLPPLVEDYWRVATLSRSKGMRWSHQPHENEFVDLSLGPSNARCLIEQTIYSQTQGEANEFVALDRPLSGTFRRTAPQRVSSYVCSTPVSENPDTEILSVADRARYLAVEEPISPEVKKLVTALHHPGLSGPEQASVILRYFKNHGFRYTLMPGELSAKHSLDDFLFSIRAGFCEHYSAALATLLRLEGVPARVVVGFQGGVYNRYGGYWLISYQDAHAWVEVWSKRGWFRVDPVAVLAPVELQAHHDTTTLLSRVSALPGVEAAWLILDSTFFKVQQLFSGRDKFLALADVTLDPFLALASLIVLFLILQLKKWRQPVNLAIQEQFREMCRVLAAQGIRRERSEGYDAYRKRVVAWLKQNEHNFDLIAPLNFLFDEYLKLRFEKTSMAQELNKNKLDQFARQIRNFRRRLSNRFKFKFLSHS